MCKTVRKCRLTRVPSAHCQPSLPARCLCDSLGLGSFRSATLCSLKAHALLCLATVSTVCLFLSLTYVAIVIFPVSCFNNYYSILFSFGILYPRKNSVQCSLYIYIYFHVSSVAFLFPRCK
jgi:hypothetical protein